MFDQEENLFEGVEELKTPSNTDTSVKDVVASEAPSMLSPEWHDYAMTLFQEDELMNGHPLVNGLRRVSELVLGPMTFSGPTWVKPTDRDDHHGRATVIFTIEFANGLKCSEVADSWEGNTDDMFCAFAVAIASTRAEARALRKVLKIKGVAAEELTKKDTAKIVRDLSKQNNSSGGEYEDSGRMSDAQYNFIDVKCKQLNVNGGKLFKDKFQVDNNRKISKKVASDIIDVLNDYQRDRSGIPSELKGYNPEWRG
ncbi:MAG: hypothetical protein CBC91_03250 [Rickettsiales bacterium TMED131]|jgi:hypothetical protein|nr:MAG: hypothetical protein CBC91_03250 [Rickettsiales bacterium TMED131]